MTTAWDLMDDAVARLWSYAPDVSPAEAADAGAVLARVASILARLSTKTIEGGDLVPMVAALRPPVLLVQSLTALDLPPGRATELVSGLGDVLALSTPDTRWHSVAAAGLLADVAYAAAEVVALAAPVAGRANRAGALQETRSVLDAVPAGPPTDHPRAAWMHRPFPPPPPASGLAGTAVESVRAVTDAVAARLEGRNLTSVDLKHAVRAALDVLHHGRTTPGVVAGEDADQAFATAKAWNDLLVVLAPMTDGFPTLDASLVAPVDELGSALRDMDAAGFADASAQLPVLASVVQSAIAAHTEAPGHLPRLLAPVNARRWAMVQLYDPSARDAPPPYVELTTGDRHRLLKAGSTAVFETENLSSRLRQPTPVSAPPIAPGGPRPPRAKPPRELKYALSTSRRLPMPFLPVPPAPSPPSMEM